jgi:hypothetical protein
MIDNHKKNRLELAGLSKRKKHHTVKIKTAMLRRIKTILPIPHTKRRNSEESPLVPSLIILFHLYLKGSIPQVSLSAHHSSESRDQPMRSKLETLPGDAGNMNIPEDSAFAAFHPSDPE